MDTYIYNQSCDYLSPHLYCNDIIPLYSPSGIFTVPHISTCDISFDKHSCLQCLCSICQSGSAYMNFSNTCCLHNTQPSHLSDGHRSTTYLDSEDCNFRSELFIPECNVYPNNQLTVFYHSNANIKVYEPYVKSCIVNDFDFYGNNSLYMSDYDVDVDVNNNNKSTLDTGDTSVINLSNFQLSPDAVSLLTKGLNFCPTPGEPDLFELRRDLDRFHVNLRRKLFFQKSPLQPNLDSSTISLPETPSEPDPSDPFNHRTFRNPSTWCPFGPINLEAMITFNENRLNYIKPRAPCNQNLTPGEKLALAELRRNTDIVIKPADKGSAVVVQNREDYILEGYRQLQDPNYYREVPTDLTALHNRDIHSYVDSLLNDDEISLPCHKFLCTKEPRTPQLYLLPKIHKNKTPVPGRPIVSANSSPTERISQLADHFLKPLVQDTKSYVRDTSDFIRKIEAIPALDPHSILCTVDVTSLYTNIPNDEGISACASQLATHRSGSDKPSNTSITKLLELVLTKNNFDFNQKHYLQVGGTAMGTRVAPSLANLFMADFEDRWVYTYPHQPRIWLRYIDDIFLVWDHNQDELDVFLNHLNTCHPTIKFTSEVSSHSVNFLDTKVIKGPDNFLYTDLFCKPTDSHNYLQYNSAHPGHCTKSLPYSQFLRTRRICKHITDFDRNALMLASHFTRRGYPDELIEGALIQARRADRTKLLRPKDKSVQTFDDSKLFCITTHSPGHNLMRNIVEDNWPILGRTNTTMPLHSKKIIFGNRRNKNLKDILVNAKLPDKTIPRSIQQQRSKLPLRPCWTVKCRYCPTINRTGSITSHNSGRNYTAKHSISCKSHNLIYCIQCKHCHKQYVGQTRNRIMDRFQSHFYNITTNNQNDPIGRHFNSAGHTQLKDITIYVLDFVQSPGQSPSGKRERDHKEKKWIYQLMTISPLGINTVD